MSMNIYEIMGFMETQWLYLKRWGTDWQSKRQTFEKYENLEKSKCSIIDCCPRPPEMDMGLSGWWPER